MQKITLTLLRVFLFAIAACAVFAVREFQEREVSDWEWAGMAARGLPLIAIPAQQRQSRAVSVRSQEMRKMPLEKQFGAERIHSV